jgi:NADH-quinone oxidoreductase subunit L
MSNEQDIRNMGGLSKYLPITYRTFLVATLAISGIPLLSGFFSKDEILWKAFSSDHGHPLLWVVGFITAGLTAFYMFRLVYLTFYGGERMSAEAKQHLHESPRSMTVPLMILAVLSIIGGFVGMPHVFGVANYFEEWLEPVMAGGHISTPELARAAQGSDPGMEVLLMALSVLLVLGAIWLARYYYDKNTAAVGRLRERFSGTHRLLLNKYYIDEVYGAVVVRPLVYGSVFLWKIVDVLIIDGFMNGLAFLAKEISDTLRYVQSGRVRGYATLFVLGVVLVVGYLLLS